MLDAGFQSLVGFRIPSAGFRIPNTRIPDSTSKKFLDSGIRIPLHGAKFRGYIPHILSKLRCTCLLRMSPDWIKFDTQLIISVQLLIRKRKAEKFSYVFKKKKWNNQRNEYDRIWNNNFPSLQLQYFEKGCRKKWTRQSRKVLWVVLNSLFFKGVWKNDTRGHGRMFANGKRKQQK